MTEPTTEPTDAPPRRRLRKRWIVLTVLLALPLIGGWLMFREPVLAVMRLPNGRNFTIHKLTYGKEHSYRPAGRGVALTPMENWLNRWLTGIGRQIQVADVGGQYGSQTESVGMWHSFDWTKKEVEATPSHIVLTDGHGWRTVIDTTHLQTAPPPLVPPGQPYTPAWITGPLVSPCSSLHVQLFNKLGKELAATRIPYDVPQSLQQQWTGQSLPVTQTDGNVSVTLKGLHASWLKTVSELPNSGDALAIACDLAVAVDGADSPDWGIVSEGIPFLELATTGAAVQSPQGWYSPLSACTVSPHASLWSLHLPFIRRNPDDVPATDRFRLGQTKFEKTPLPETAAGEATPVGQTKVQLLGAGRAGSFSYEGVGESPFPFSNPYSIEWATRKQLQGTIQMTVPIFGGNYSITYGPSPVPARKAKPSKYPMTIALKFTAPRPHVVISVDQSGDRIPLVIVKDENGRALDGELFNMQGLLVWLAKQAYDDVQELDVTLLLQKPREFTFIVPPPALPPRPAPPSQ